MRRVIGPVVLAALCAGVLAACAPPEVDWVDAEARAASFQEERAADAPLGVATVNIGSAESGPEDESVVRLEFAEPSRVDGFTVACFGDPASVVFFGYTVRQGSSWVGGEAAEVNCDGEETRVAPATPSEGVDAVSVTGQRTAGGGGVLVVLIDGEEAGGE
ncbi:hypothetical protein [Microbacterium aurantiacum]|uniref:Lipoprotein n=1 Tax=Microbacterium aurantiacum TaxID=162393 RepID=A0AAJ2LVU7_9MICO|nr:hypothetical protein [Microbacterium aurantiacum]MDS0245650.1 hypothetical protein [Microbacterium aurantiacum]